MVDASGDHLLFHAGAVQGANGGVMLPGVSGSGKSTLVAGLVRGGLGYLSDEVVAVSLSEPLMLPYPKAIRRRARRPWNTAAIAGRCLIRGDR